MGNSIALNLRSLELAGGLLLVAGPLFFYCLDWDTSCPLWVSDVYQGTVVREPLEIPTGLVTFLWCVWASWVSPWGWRPVRPFFYLTRSSPVFSAVSEVCHAWNGTQRNSCDLSINMVVKELGMLFRFTILPSVDSQVATLVLVLRVTFSLLLETEEGLALLLTLVRHATSLPSVLS